MSAAAAPFLRASAPSLGDLLSSIRASQSVNSSSPGAEAVEVTEGSLRICGRTMLSGLAKRGEELRTRCFSAAIEEEADEVWRERRLDEVEEESERSRELRERLGPGWKSMSAARDDTGVGSWKRTVRLGLLLLLVAVEGEYGR